LPGLIAACVTAYALNLAVHGGVAALTKTLEDGSTDVASPSWWWALCGALFYGACWLGNSLLRLLDAEFRRTHSRADLVFTVLAPPVGGAVGGWLIYWLAWLFAQFDMITGTWLAVGVGTALMLKIFSLMIVVHIGLAARGFGENDLEWWGRLGGITLMLAIAWLVVFGIAIYGAAFSAWAGSWVVSAGYAAWLASTITGIVLGRSEKTGGSGSSRGLEMVAAIAPYVFILGLLLLLACGLDYLQGGITARARTEIPVAIRESTETAIKLPLNSEVSFVRSDNGSSLSTEPAAELNLRASAPGTGVKLSLPVAISLAAVVKESLHGMGAGAACQSNLYQCPAEAATNIPVPCLFAACALVFLLLSWRLDVNLFSMHHFYRSRLARCYLGATNAQRRKPSPFSGFDPDDDAIKLADCRQRPYPLINTALNLVRSDHLAWQQRMAASFLFTPKYCGFQFPRAAPGAGDGPAGCIGGFRPTAQYLGGAPLATAFTISGAAASPNMGYHSSPVLAFLLTLFNVRLGRWCGNPTHASAWQCRGPRFGGKYLLAEMFARTDERSPFVYLSDGGHFENLGIYELVRRQCRYIIVCDAGQDENLGFEDLGNAIRKCYTDLGVRIEIDAEPLRRDPGTGYSRQHCVVGKVHYPEAEAGVLVYLKASLTGDEPTEILQYSRMQPSFPHQSTADQWFDETQFESYRALGEHIADTALRQAEEWSRRREGP